jgi:hypothetical protein
VATHVCVPSAGVSAEPRAGDRTRGGEPWHG